LSGAYLTPLPLKNLLLNSTQCKRSVCKKHSIESIHPKIAKLTPTNPADPPIAIGIPKPKPLLDSQENLIDANKDKTNTVAKSKKTEEDDAPHDEHDAPFGELMIHQLIETIEFALGSISNTASYLRLWALSLAHSQLSQTFLQMTFQNYIKKPSSIGLGIPIAIGGSAGFVGVSFAILGCMDSMECFLHTLRLHWVEFNNKFFKGNGVKYAPLNYENRPEIGQA